MLVIGLGDYFRCTSLYLYSFGTRVRAPGALCDSATVGYKVGSKEVFFKVSDMLLFFMSLVRFIQSDSIEYDETVYLSSFCEELT